MTSGQTNTTTLRVSFLLPLAVAALLVSSCATRNVNPAQARATTGYVDLYAASPDELYWEVAHFEDRQQNFKTIFSELNPPPHGFLRLAFPPGPCRLRVTFLNRLIATPAEIVVEVPDGKIIPVSLTFTGGGTALVETKEQTRGGTVRGRYGPRTKIGGDATTFYNLSAQANPPTTYQRKEQMPYAR